MDAIQWKCYKQGTEPFQNTNIVTSESVNMTKMMQVPSMESPSMMTIPTMAPSTMQNFQNVLMMQIPMAESEMMQSPSSMMYVPTMAPSTMQNFQNVTMMKMPMVESEMTMSSSSMMNIAPTPIPVMIINQSESNKESFRGIFDPKSKSSIISGDKSSKLSKIVSNEKHEDNKKKNRKSLSKQKKASSLSGDKSSKLSSPSKKVEKFETIYMVLPKNI